VRRRSPRCWSGGNGAVAAAGQFGGGGEERHRPATVRCASGRGRPRARCPPPPRPRSGWRRRGRVRLSVTAVGLLPRPSRRTHGSTTVAPGRDVRSTSDVQRTGNHNGVRRQPNPAATADRMPALPGPRPISGYPKRMPGTGSLSDLTMVSGLLQTRSASPSLARIRAALWSTVPGYAQAAAGTGPVSLRRALAVAGRRGGAALDGLVEGKASAGHAEQRLRADRDGGVRVATVAIRNRVNHPRALIAAFGTVIVKAWGTNGGRGA
jgi:hypothetical protein